MNRSQSFSRPHRLDRPTSAATEPRRYARWGGSLLLGMALLVGTSGCFGHLATAEETRLAKAQYDLANDAFQRGQYREALEQVDRSLDLDERQADAAYLGAMVMLVFCAQDDASSDCRYERAEHYIRRALVADPEMRDAKNALGVILVHQGKTKEAAAVLEPLAKDILYRSPEKAWGNLGWAYLESGRVDEALSALKRAIAAQPMFCVGHYRLGLALEKKGEYTAAHKSLTRALDIEEGDCQRLQAALWARARISEKLGMTAELRDDLQRCQELTSSTDIGRQCRSRLEAND